MLISLSLLTDSTATSSGVGWSEGDSDTNANSSTIVIVAASLAAVLLLALIVLVVVLLLRRRKRHGHGKGECLSLRMSYSFESSGRSSGMILFCNVSHRQCHREVADHLYTKFMSYHSSRYLYKFPAGSVNSLVGCLIHLSYIFRLPHLFQRLRLHKTIRSQRQCLRTFTLIISGHIYCACKFTRHVMHESAR